MKRTILFLLCWTLFGCASNAQTKNNSTTFTLTSENLEGQATAQEVFSGCGGINKSPQLSWENAPEGTKSFAIIMYDPDAPTGSGWWHWLVVNLPANTNSLPINAGDPAAKLLPEGVVQTRTDYGTVGYGGPCPPEGHGLHQYMITVHALKTDRLDIKSDAIPATVGYQVNANTIGKASLVFYHQR